MNRALALTFIHAVRNVIEHFFSNDSTVNVCALDSSKTFDLMNHYVLYIKLMKRKLPTQLLTALESWLITCRPTTCIRWNGRSHAASYWLLVWDLEELCHHFCFLCVLTWLLKGLKHLTSVAILSLICWRLFLWRLCWRGGGKTTQQGYLSF